MKKVFLALTLVIAAAGFTMAQTSPAPKKENKVEKKETQKAEKSEKKPLKHSKHHAKVVKHQK